MSLTNGVIQRNYDALIQYWEQRAANPNDAQDALYSQQMRLWARDTYFHHRGVGAPASRMLMAGWANEINPKGAWLRGMWYQMAQDHIEWVETGYNF